MTRYIHKRRDVLSYGASLAASFLAGQRAYAQAFPRSSGGEMRRTIVPPGAADCHLHIFEAGYPVQVGPTISKFVDHATIDDYLKIRLRLGLSRSVLVQPSTYGADNAVLLAALKRLGDSARGVAVIVPGVSETALSDLAAQGIRGIRFNLVQSGTTDIGMVEQLAKTVAPLGWHCSFYVSPDMLVQSAALFKRLPTPIVLEHTASLYSVAPDHPAVATVLGLLDKGNTWIKLTSAIRNGDDREKQAEKFVRAVQLLSKVPDRLVWGSDWPHVGSIGANIPDDAFNFDLLQAAIDGPENLHRILVGNPARLYGFPTMSVSLTP